MKIRIEQYIENKLSIIPIVKFIDIKIIEYQKINAVRTETYIHQNIRIESSE